MVAVVPHRGRGPRSRRAVGVGDVAGERRDREALLGGFRAFSPGRRVSCADGEAHKSLIRRATNAFNERDVDEVVASMHSEAEVKLIGGFDRDGAALRETRSATLLPGMVAAFKTMTVEVERFLDAGEQILILTRLNATGIRSDVPVELLGAGAFYSFRDSKIARIDFYYDRDTPSRPPGCRSSACGALRRNHEMELADSNRRPPGCDAGWHPEARIGAVGSSKRNLAASVISAPGADGRRSLRYGRLRHQNGVGAQWRLFHP